MVFLWYNLTSNFLKTAFHKLYVVHSWISVPIYGFYIDPQIYSSLYKKHKKEITLLVLFPFSIGTKYSIKIVGQVFSQVNLTQFFLANFFQLAHGKISKCHLIFWCRNFVGTYVFRRVSDDLFETLQTLCVSTKFHNKKLGEITEFYVLNTCIYFNTD